MESYLCVVASDPGTAAPGTDTDVCFSVCKTSNETLELREVFDGGDSLDVALFVQMDALFQRRFCRRARSMPGCVELLHEKRVAFPRLGFAHLLDGEVASGADDVAHVDEVVAHEAVLGDLGLFAFLAIVDGDDGA